MTKKELAAIADECLLDAWKKYQESKGITEGDISPDESFTWDELMGQVADFIIKVSNHNLPTFLDDEEKMADFEILSKEEFLSSYSYISEEEYDHTKEMKEFFEDKTPERNYDFEEICPHCDHVNQVKWDRKSHTIICEGCGERILLCNLCDMDTVTCGKCPYESELEEKE